MQHRKAGSQLTLKIATNLSYEMETLRRSGFRPCNSSHSTEDQYDTHSEHVCIYKSDTIIGMVRITRQPPSVLSSWAIKSTDIPCGPHVVELTRAIVSADWRELGLYKLLMAYTTLYLAEWQDVEVSVGAIEYNFPAWAFLRSIGFEEVCTAYFSDFPAPLTRRARCIMQRPRLSTGRAKTAKLHLENQLTRHGILISNAIHAKK